MNINYHETVRKILPDVAISREEWDASAYQLKEILKDAMRNAFNAGENNKRCSAVTKHGLTGAQTTLTRTFEEWYKIHEQL